MSTNSSLNDTVYRRTSEPAAVSTGNPVAFEPPQLQASSGDGGAAMARTIYLAFIAGFFFPPIALIAVILAYVQRDPAAHYTPHFTFQIRTFWCGLAIQVAALLLYLVLGAAAALVNGSFFNLLVPAGLMLFWVVFTLGRIARGLRALNRGQATVA